MTPGLTYQPQVANAADLARSLVVAYAVMEPGGTYDLKLSRDNALALGRLIEAAEAVVAERSAGASDLADAVKTLSEARAKLLAARRLLFRAVWFFGFSVLFWLVGPVALWGSR